MQNRRGAGEHGDVLRLGDESGVGDRDCIFTERKRIEVELSVSVGFGGLREFRIASFENHQNVLHRAMLRIMNYAANASKNRG